MAGGGYSRPSTLGARIILWRYTSPATTSSVCSCRTSQSLSKHTMTSYVLGHAVEQRVPPSAAADVLTRERYRVEVAVRHLLQPPGVPSLEPWSST